MCHKRAIVCGFCVVVGGIFSYTRSLQTSSQQKSLGASRRMLTNGIRFQYKSSQPLEKSQQNCQRMTFRLGSSHLTFIRIEIWSKKAFVWNRKFCLEFNTLHRFDLKLSQCAPYHLFLIMVWFFIYESANGTFSTFGTFSYIYIDLLRLSQ